MNMNRPLMEYLRPIDSFIIKGRAGTGALSAMIDHSCQYATDTGSAVVLLDTFDFTLSEIQEKYPGCEIINFNLETGLDINIRLKSLLMYLNKPVMILYRYNRFANRLGWLSRLSYTLHKFGKELSIGVTLFGYHQLPATKKGKKREYE